jgi:ATP-dependent helicase YprA (DUF1998 family)/serine/threonine protein kinase
LQQRYRIEETLGRGGFGAVYGAFHEELQTHVAVKEALHADDPRMVDRFREEAQILNRLSHPALPRVKEYFREGGNAYLVMDYVPGMTLGAYLQQFPTSRMEWLDALRLLAPVLDALDYLHCQHPPVLHRDIKPDNIRITPDGEVFLVDFSIARFYLPDERTATAAHAFSSGYSPYEQYRRSLPTSTRSDLYALGATLYRMLSGIPPQDALDRIATDPLVPIEDLNPSVPTVGQEVMRRMMAVFPEDRSASVAEVRADLADELQQAGVAGQGAWIGGQGAGVGPHDYPTVTAVDHPTDRVADPRTSYQVDPPSTAAHNAPTGDAEDHPLPNLPPSPQPLSHPGSGASGIGSPSPLVGEGARGRGESEPYSPSPLVGEGARGRGESEPYSPSPLVGEGARGREDGDEGLAASSGPWSGQRSPSPPPLDVFWLRDQLTGDYQNYIRSFIRIRDAAIRDQVEQEMQEGLLWPDPLIQLNPSFKPGAWIDDLVKDGTLHAECSRIFRKDKAPGNQAATGMPLRLHVHQREAIQIARGGHNYVLTTGTGSGKSLSYIVPIVDYVLRNGSGSGIKAIIVYPMNALANSQYGELEKFLLHGYPEDGHPVTFRRYTGQESAEVKNEVIHNPPDILLTNFVMLELMLTRPSEQPLVAAARGLRFLVLDELHTYRGRQGADVALLVRRTHNRMAPDFLQCVGTSATLAGPGSYDEQRAEVARVAAQLFGAEVKPAHVIGETLQRVTPDRSPTDPHFLQDLRERLQDTQSEPPTGFAEFINDPLATWIETTFGVKTDPDSGRLVRSAPTSITGPHGAARQLHTLTGVPEPLCSEQIKRVLLASYACEPDIRTGFPPFAFRLHQFISRGDTVYATVQPEQHRYITLHGQRYRPGDRSQVLLPLVFCRECGQEYYSVRMLRDSQQDPRSFVPRDLTDQFSDGESTIGFLYLNSDDPFPDHEAAMIERLPEDWLEEYRETRRVRKNRRSHLPQAVHVGSDGVESPQGVRCSFLPGQFRFCLHCGVAYDPRQSSDFAKLATLGSEGRSTATTILSLSAVRRLHESDLAATARKLLSFTDNRQDASLQAGHFNDFIEIGLLRAALYRAVHDAGEAGISHEHLTQRVFDALNLPLSLYTGRDDLRFRKLDDAQRALRDVLGYRLYRDLRRGWRITSPNLEQCGLLQIVYRSLDEVCAAEDLWQACHPALVTASPTTRQQIAKVLLDYMRRELAIRVDYLNPRYQETIQQQSNQHLMAPWSLDDKETLDHAAVLYPRPASKSSGQDYGGNVYLSAYGGFGQYLRRASSFPDYAEHPITRDETADIIRQILGALEEGGLVERVTQQSSTSEAQDDPGYQLPAAALLWLADDGSRAFHDPIRVPNAPETGGRTNPFFVAFYTTIAQKTLGLEAREHTAQVPYDEREQREERFRRADLPILYCSPTMELGIDIAQLNVVNMRNIPPTPANYAQRSGRAGRSGQPALVFSYCATGSSHDQYFFRRPHMMVAGKVATPRLDLANEDLVRSHISAIWLAEVGIPLGESLKDILDVSGDQPSLVLLDPVRAQISSERARQQAQQRAEHVLATIQHEVTQSDWYHAAWLAQVLDGCVSAFDRACDRWRTLYRAALAQAAAQDRIIRDASRSAEDKKQANRLRREAEEQLRLLTEVRSISQSDFYSYRYFASEGFLPGYSFPRLPLSAYIPARHVRQQERDDFLSRPRFLAISEFGPRAIVYHEGSRYTISRVILPVGSEDVLTRSILLCPACGYLQPPDDGGDISLCKRCGAKLDIPMTNLFRMENVVTRRRDRINSDEEERMRMGYEIVPAVRFEQQGDTPTRTATVVSRGVTLAHLSYAQPATLWRINLGWARRKNKEQRGFVLDVERGYWARNEQQEPADESDPLSARTRRVIPYVEDRRNCLLVEIDVATVCSPSPQPLSHRGSGGLAAHDSPPAPSSIAGEGEQRSPSPLVGDGDRGRGDFWSATDSLMASLQAALKSAIQVTYQLEENELAAEPLPDRRNRRLLLFYESAEGGAGVLRRLLDDPYALATVARNALHLCHFDPQSGKDKRRAPQAREDCEAACYDCLMSYANQQDHRLLDRHAIRDLLLKLAQAEVQATTPPPTATSPEDAPLDDLLARLPAQADGSETIAHRWLRFMAARGYQVPPQAYAPVVACGAQPDFLYEGYPAAIYVDGDDPTRRARDSEQVVCMEDDYAMLVLRFGPEETWTAMIARYPSLFGTREE